MNRPGSQSNGEHRSGRRVNDGGHFAIHEAADLDIGGEGRAIALAGLGGGGDEAHGLIHVDDGHHCAGAVGDVAAGAVKGPTVVEADLAQVEGRVVERVILLLHGAADLFLTLVADAELTAGLEPVAALGEGEGTHLHGRGLQRNPRGDGVWVAEGPIVLVGVPRGDAAARLLVERLVVIHPHAADAEQFGGEAGEALAPAEFPHGFILGPDIADLEKRLAVGIALRQRQVHGVEPVDLGGDNGPVMIDDVGGQDIFQLDVAILAKARDLVGGERERGVEVEVGGAGDHDSQT